MHVCDIDLIEGYQDLTDLQFVHVQLLILQLRLH